jgi:hypothetical protein
MATLATLRQRLSEEIGDWLQSTVTTNLTTNTSIVDTNLANVEGGWITDYFEDWFALITSQNNSGENRSVSAYDASTNTLTVRGSNFSADTSAATYELHRINPDHMTRAINLAARDIYPALFRRLRDRTLVCGSMLPNSHFEDWAVSTYPDFWRVSNVTATKETTSIWGGAASAAVVRSGTDGYMYVSEAEYPRLLDLMGEEISFYCMVKASTASQAYIEIYTKQADGTTQTETSDAHSGNGEFELLKIEDFTLNDDLTDIQFRCKVINSDGTAYFDAAWTSGGAVRELLLPTDFANGVLLQVNRQVSGHSDEIANDIGWGSRYAEVFGWKIKEDDNKYLVMPWIVEECRLELIGYAPLEDDLSSDTDTMTIDDPHTNLLIAQACLNLYRILRGFPSSDATSRYDEEIAYWTAKVAERKRRLRMHKPAGQISWTA